VAAPTGMRQTLGMRDGEPMMIPCRGGPTGWRTATFPPPLEVEINAGVYVLVDDGQPECWMYEFVDVGAEA